MFCCILLCQGTKQCYSYHCQKLGKIFTGLTYELLLSFAVISDVYRSFIPNKTTFTKCCLTQWISKIMIPIYRVWLHGLYGLHGPCCCPGHQQPWYLLCWAGIIWSPPINILRPRQNGRHFPDDIFKCIFVNENVWILVKISLKFVPKGPINNIPALVQIMAWHRPGDKPLYEPRMGSLLTPICVTRPQWVNG